MKKLTHKQIMEACNKARKRCSKMSKEEREKLIKLGREIISSKKRLQNYYECVGCGNCVDVDIKRGKCIICGCQKWIARTTYINDK